MSKMCTISTDSFDYEAARTGIFQISNALGTDLLDAYIGLTANQKVSELLLLPVSAHLIFNISCTYSSIQNYTSCHPY